MTTKEFLARVDRTLNSCAGLSEACCKKGCSHCCSEPLYVDEREADYMIQSLDPKLRDRVEKNTGRWIQVASPLLGVVQPNALVYRSLANPCPFLIDNLCSVYESRPFGCREFCALGNPGDCKMPNREYQKFATLRPNQMAWVMLPFIQDQDRVVIDHLGVFLAEKLLGIKLKSASRMEENHVQQHFRLPPLSAAMPVGMPSGGH